MSELKVTVRNKIATADGQTVVCGNSDYTVHFDLDAEWGSYETKTMRVVYHDHTYTDVVFTGIEAPLPVVVNQSAIRVGLFAGDLHTSSPAYFPCVLSILCDTGSPVDPEPDVYAQIMELLNKDSGVWYPSVQDGVVSWHRSISETEPTPVNIQGPAGPAGATGPAGPQGEAGAKGDTGEKGEKGDTGANGANGITPTIGTNGNWYLGDTDTGKPSRGATGADGAKGDTGAPGAKGADGISPVLSIGTVETLEAGSAATATMTGTDANPVLNLGIPKGEKGADGSGGSSMDISGATVGQIAKITAVDDSGVPTAWEPVDLPSGGKEWIKICDYELTDGDVQRITVSQLPDGTPLAGLGIKEIIFTGSVLQTENGSYNYAQFLVNDLSIAVGQNFGINATYETGFRGRFKLIADRAVNIEWSAAGRYVTTPTMQGGGLVTEGVPIDSHWEDLSAWVTEIKSFRLDHAGGKTLKTVRLRVYGR